MLNVKELTLSVAAATFYAYERTPEVFDLGTGRDAAADVRFPARPRIPDERLHSGDGGTAHRQSEQRRDLVPLDRCLRERRAGARQQWHVGRGRPGPLRDPE